MKVSRLLMCLPLLVMGCKTHLAPVYYSPQYQADGLPSQCQQPPAKDEIGLDEDFKATLPLGCANNLNLMQMVEQRQDLNQGRATGPAMAAPVGRAAQVYIEGFDREQLQRRQAQQEAKAGAPGGEQ
ncbi:MULTISPECIES: hypothetical protein [unclassified Pseudomonas]|jgi:type IV pilus biogenesis protein CpaD/CtpE|uniref:hypothetical protein n=1 Tax=unclassified Pseudomonas TaxID=196821 RepID=UPI001462D2D7|nr:MULTISPECIES: hypothetical protein [unclassified Pseudomonas]MBK5438600.1 hypothetical protein [Pseudomonas sp. TH32]MDF3202582.1 hypothetical protein [Pseudomonas sp. 1912-s]QJI38892.1 hypothetical protein HKK54_32330 [Pseudomonas sp. ADAK13]